MRVLLAVAFLLALSSCFPEVNAEGGTSQPAKIRTVSYASQTGSAEGSDSDYSADPLWEPFKKVDDADAKPVTSTNECELKRYKSDDARVACAAQMARYHCESGHGVAKPGECSECDRWANLPTCPTYPPYRTAAQ